MNKYLRFKYTTYIYKFAKYKNNINLKRYILILFKKFNLHLI